MPLEVVLFEQDKNALAHAFRRLTPSVDARFPGRVRLVFLHDSIKRLLRDGSLFGPFGKFDLIYSAGLYDYLPDGLARRLTARLLQMLRPSGRLVIANFVPGGSGRGYMELFMDWTLVLRNEAAMRDLSFAAGAAQVNTFHDPHRNVVYVEVERPW